MPKNTRTASAESDFPISSSDLNALATAANYNDFYSFATALGKGTIFKATNFGSSVTVKFGSYSWFPVYAMKDGNDIILTLYLENALSTNYSFSDGSQNGTYNSAACSEYQYSWIRAAINAGHTEEGVYYGDYSLLSGSDYNVYSNNDKSQLAVMAPTDFTYFAEFVEGGDYAKYVVPGETGDNVWLPSTDEAKAGGKWGLTSVYFGAHNGSAGEVWSRTRNYDYYCNYGFTIVSSGGTDYWQVTKLYGIRPAVQVKLPVVVQPTKDTSAFTYNGTEFTYSPAGFDESTMKIAGNKATDAGDYNVTVTLADGYTWTDGTTAPVEFTFTINKATPSVSPSFGSNRPFVTSGFPEPEGYTAGYSGIDITGTFSWPNQVIEANVSKAYTWLFTPDDEFLDNFNTVTGEQTFNFMERTVKEMEPIFNSNGKTVYTKTSKDELMDMITLKVTYNDGEVVEETNFDINYSLSEGYGNTITVLFGNQAPKIVNVEDYVVLAEVESVTTVYNQGSNKITPLNGINDLKQYLTVYPKWNYTNTSEPLGDEDYSLEGELTVGSPEIYVVYEGIKELIKPAPMVSKAVYDTSNLKFEDKLAPYTGEAFDTDGWVTGLPAGVTVSYTCTTDMTEIGTHTVTAHFDGDYENYEAIADKTATLTIENNYALPELVEDTLGYNPDGNTFEIINFEGVKDIVKLTFNGQAVTDINAVLTQTEIGEYTLEITLTEGKFLGDRESVTLTFSIVKRVVQMPEFLGGLAYSGKTITPTADNFDYDSVGCYFVSAESGLNAGSYFATFKLVDTEHYEWANTNTRSAVRLALADEELNEGEIQVPWTIAKATVSATAEEGKLPAFSCATVSDLSKYISYTYYKDEACTEKVAYSDMQPDTRYYVKATFADEDENFELDDSALGVIGSTISYDAPAAEPNFFQKAMAYIKEHWLWFAIGAGVLLFLILLIIIIAVARRKNKEKREERKAEKKEEERQRRAEEREERMMRMQGMQSMGGMLAQQAMPTAQPQPAQSAGNDVNAQLLAEMRAQMAELRAENKAAQAVQQPIQPIQQPIQPQMPVQAQQIQPNGAYILEERLRAAEERARYAEERMSRAEEERARQAEERTLRAAEERARLAEEQLLRNAYMPRLTPTNGGESGNISLDALGALVLAALKNYAVKDKAEPNASAEQPQMIEAGSSQTGSIPAVYPPDAVVTTTTTVDTTKGSPVKRSREEDRNFDIDGFYDKFE